MLPSGHEMVTFFFLAERAEPKFLGSTKLEGLMWITSTVITSQSPLAVARRSVA